MNKIIKLLIVVTLALVVALCVGCGKKKDSSDKKDNISSVLTDGFLNEIFGDEYDDGESVDKDYEDEVDAGALDALEGQGSSSNASSNATSSKDDTSKDTSTTSSKDNGSKDSSSSSSKNESSSKNDSSSSKNQTSGSTSSSTSSKNNVSTDNDSTIYTPGWS